MIYMKRIEKRRFAGDGTLHAPGVNVLYHGAVYVHAFFGCKSINAFRFSPRALADSTDIKQKQAMTQHRLKGYLPAYFVLFLL